MFINFKKISLWGCLVLVFTTCSANVSNHSDLSSISDTNPQNPIEQNKEYAHPNSSDKFPKESYFIGFFGGPAYPKKFTQALKNGYSVGIQYGYHDENYRTELALNFIGNDIRNITIANYAIINLMLNAYYDFNYHGIFVPFLGAGLGYANAWRNNCTAYQNHCIVLQTGNKFAYQGIAGFGFNIKSIARLDFRYRYLALDHSQNFSENIGEVVLNLFF